MRIAIRIRVPMMQAVVTAPCENRILKENREPSWLTKFSKNKSENKYQQIMNFVQFTIKIRNKKNF